MIRDHNRYFGVFSPVSVRKGLHKQITMPKSDNTALLWDIDRRVEASSGCPVDQADQDGAYEGNKNKSQLSRKLLKQ